MKTIVTNSQRGMTLIEMLVVVVVGVLVAMMVPGWLASGRHHHGWGNTCVNNLRQNELALKTWAVDHDDHYPMTTSVTNGGTMEFVVNGLAYEHFQVMSNELSAPVLVVCPMDKSRTRAKSYQKDDFSNANVSYFLGVDASDVYPQMILIGDRNLTLDGVEVKPGLVSFTTNNVGWTSELHNGQANIGLADGSVQQVSPARFKNAVQTALIGTNRWVVP